MTDTRLNGYATRLDDLLRRDPAELIAKVQQRTRQKLEQHRHSLVLFGTGALGRLALAKLRQLDQQPVAFADNNAALRGKEVEGVPVFTPQEAHAQYPDALFVVTIYTNTPVLAQLAQLRVPAITYAELAWCYPEVMLPHVALDLPSKIFTSRSEVRAGLQLWADDASREEFVGQIAWRSTLDPAVLPAPEPAAETYFAPELIKPTGDEVFVDCGSFDGDTLRAFLQRCGGEFRKAIAVEPDPHNRARIAEWLEKLSRDRSEKIEIVPFAAGERRETLTFDATGTVTSSVGAGTSTVEAAPLDELLRDCPPTFVKMDIEGAEPSALRGAAGLIGRHSPVLAVCLYHAQEHLWELPQLIHRLNPDYDLFLRRYSDECWELICYAIPRHRRANINSAEQ